MTLSIGDHLLKLDKDGKPLSTDREVYIEWEVIEMGTIDYDADGNSVQNVKLKKVK